MSEIYIRDAGAIRIISLNRPDQRNAINLATARQLEDAVTALDQDPSVSVAVLTGAGGVFSAGMDLKAFARGERPMTERGGFAGFVRRPPVKPVVAAVEGWALAGGCELALACDLIVAGQGARFGLPEVKRGLVAAGGGVTRLARALPHQTAMEMILTGEPITADQALARGLVNRVVADGTALEGALALAEAIAQNGPLALRVSKEIAVSASGYFAAEEYDRQRASSLPVFDSVDAKEGARAFAEKRTPEWIGA